MLGIALTGLPAWLLWRAYYRRMPTAGRKLRIWVEWTWSLFFPRHHPAASRAAAGIDAAAARQSPAAAATAFPQP